jgi:hypothetical protein
LIQIIHVDGVSAEPWHGEPGAIEVRKGGGIDGEAIFEQPSRGVASILHRYLKNITEAGSVIEGSISDGRGP